MKKYHCLVNRSVVINSLEVKAKLTGYQWTRPNNINTDFIEKRDRSGEFLYYQQTTPVEILDVDGQQKRTVKTSYFLADKQTPYPDKKAEIGIYNGELAGKYHGAKSRHWKQKFLTLNEIIDVLNKGYAIAPGEFNPPPNESIRKSEYCTQRQFILFDADEWTSDHPAPNNIPELIERYPEIPNDFHWIGESISSRSSLKPELRCRLMMVLPHPIRQGDDFLWQTAIDSIVSKYPFIARGGGIDKVRLSFGNARPECENRRLGGIISEDTFIDWQQRATELQKEAEQQAAARRERETRRGDRDKRNTEIRNELKKRGHEIQDTRSPIEAFIADVTPISYMEKYGWITSIGGNTYHWHESGQGRSCEIVDDIIKPFSNSMQAACPPFTDPANSTINAHRFICFYEFGLDMMVENDKHELRCKLADDGYGTHPDEYQRVKAIEREAARSEALINDIPKKDTTLPPPTDDFGQRIINDKVEIPDIEVRERPPHPHFTPEQRILCEKVFYRDPNAGWFRRDDGVLYPAYITRYSNFERLTLLQSYQLNGFSEQLEKNHIIFGKPGICPKCQWGAMYAFHKYTLIGYAWCGECHELHIYGSYQGYELNRKLPNAIVSDSHEYLGKNPDFVDFRLWQPGMSTHLACAMGTGKTTAAIERGKQIAQEGKGRLIYAGPRISLIKYLTEQYRKMDGHAAWGAWHAGSGRKNRFIGNFGAFACFPSLPYVLHATLESGYVPYLVLDEFDFDYLLTQVATEQSPAIKAWLKKLWENPGIVTAGQTPYTLSIEAFTKEIAGDVNIDTCQAFHQNAPPKQKSVTLHKLVDQPGKQNILWGAAVEKAKDVLKAGKTPYIFCLLRRAAHTIADILENDTGQKGVVFDAYTKLYRQSEELLFGEKAPQGYDFVVLTGAADVGLSIKDPNGHVIVVANLNYGTLNMPSIVQMTQRVRDDVDIDIFYSENNHSLPIAPEENTTFSLEHEREKQVFNPDMYISEGAVEHIAKVRAMRDLNDADPETYIKHHLGTVANKPISEASVLGLLKHTHGDTPLSFADDPLLKKVNEVKSVKKQLQDTEREAKKEHALDILQSKDLLTLSEIRSEHKMTPERKMGHEIATGTAIALGWDEDKDNKLSDDVTELAKEIVETGINHEALDLQRRGFLSVHYRDFVQARLTDELIEATAETQTKESHAIKYDLGIGEVLQVLLDTLKGQVWTPDTLGDAVLKVLVENSLLEKLKSGKIGSGEAKRTRFLYKGNLEYILNWIKQFIETYYPLRLAKCGDNYTLSEQENYQLRIDAFNAYLKAKGYTSEIKEPRFKFVDLPEPHNELKEKARQLRAEGKTIKDIAAELDKDKSTISRWCKGIKTPEQVEREQKRQIAIEMRLENKTYEKIAKELNISKDTVRKWLS